MASNFKYGDIARNASVDAVAALCNSRPIDIRTGAPPATPATADSGTLLASPTFGATAFGAASSGTATANAIASDTNAAASGDAGHFRVKNASAVVIFQGTAGEAADTPDAEFDNKSIVAGGTVAFTTATLTQPVGGT